VLRQAPWQIVLFSLGMYLVVYGLRNAGLTHGLSALLDRLAASGLWGATLGTGLLAAALSSVMNNMPSVLVGALSIQDSQASGVIREAMIYANVIGCDLGPKITPIGSLATLLALAFTVTVFASGVLAWARGMQVARYFILAWSAFLLGGLLLLQCRVIAWRVPAGMLGALFVIALLCWNGTGSDSNGSPMLHLFSGASMLGAFFIATEPVSGARSPRGQWAFGIGVGLLTYAIRTWGNSPDGLAFAVLGMNLAVPALERIVNRSAAR